MNYKFLGKTGVKVSGLCFGTMLFGGEADRAASAALFNRCREAGINFFDCADVYTGGQAEEILGELIAPCREEVVITSKVYFATGKDVNAIGASRRHIRQGVEASLRRLKTDYLDIYFIHHFDESTPIEETLRGLEDLVRQGKILYPGASNFAAWQVAKALGVQARESWSRFEIIQPMYNLVKRQAEVEILPMALSEGLAVIPYSPMAGGLLSGKYGRDWQAEQGRFVNNQIYRARYGQEGIYDTAVAFTEFARERGYDPATLAVAWVAGHPAITAPIIGARSVKQLEASLAAADFPMTPELRAEISALSPEPPPATDRSEERTTTTFGMR